MSQNSEGLCSKSGWGIPEDPIVILRYLEPSLVEWIVPFASVLAPVHVGG